MNGLRTTLFLTACVIILGKVGALTHDEIKAFTARPHAEKNTGTQGRVNIHDIPGDPTGHLLTSNGVPDHHTGTFPARGNPNNIRVKSNYWKIPKYPQKAATTSCLPQGPIGMAINGVAMFNPYTRTCCDAGAEELDLFDDCMGHPAPEGTYHYHLSPKCLHKIVCGKPSTILGVAFDGFPIYGPIDEDGKQLTKKDLDICGGKETNGQYRYHIINEFPYIMGCYKGTPRRDSGARIRRNCQCRSPTVPCREFDRRRGKRAIADIPFPCINENEQATITADNVPNPPATISQPESNVASEKDTQQQQQVSHGTYQNPQPWQGPVYFHNPFASIQPHPNHPPHPHHPPHPPPHHVPPHHRHVMHPPPRYAYPPPLLRPW